jgi:uncharacterized small protein (DUF1192 family)
MDDDEETTPLSAGDDGMPRNLEPMSIEEIEHYIGRLSTEIERCQAEIERKRKQQQDAASLFKQ